jgi:hypothetical protein
MDERGRTTARYWRLLGLAVTVGLGLISRKLLLGVHAWDKALGDVLYAAMVYQVLSLVAPTAGKGRLALASFTLCATIELFQLTGVPMRLAQTPLRWLLGTTFAWEDLLYYALGTVGVYLLDARMGHKRESKRLPGRQSGT